jgi:hypothetical protein
LEHKLAVENSSNIGSCGKVEKSVKVDKQQFDRVLGKLIATPPIRNRELVGKDKTPKK